MYKMKSIIEDILNDIINNITMTKIIGAHINREKTLKKTIDYINLKHGDKIKLANQDLRRKWKMKQEFLSPCYTTKISDVITIK